MGIKVLDIGKTVQEIIQVLHDNDIPIGLFDYVFETVRKEAEDKTVPYSPKDSKKEK